MTVIYLRAIKVIVMRVSNKAIPSFILLLHEQYLLCLNMKCYNKFYGPILLYFPRNNKRKSKIVIFFWLIYDHFV